MLTLTTFPGAMDEPSLSNFCTKAMILLTMADEAWRPDFTFDARTAPYGKLPIVRDGDTTIADSNLLIPWLESRGANLFAGQDSATRAQAHAIIRMAEENLRYGMMYDRWVDPEGWAAFYPIVFADMPAPLRLFIPAKVRKGIVNGLRWQGLGRFGAAERLAYFQADLTALADLLWDRPWLMGDQPSAVDASVLPILSGIATLPSDTPLRRALHANAVLMPYIERGRAALYTPLTTSICAAA